MKKLSFLLFLCSGVAFADGPIFQHKDTFDQQEFENVYQNLKTVSSNNAVPSSSVTTSTLTVTSAIVGATQTLTMPISLYRKPTLQYNSGTRVDIDVNTQTSNTSGILFPDGSYRTVTEDLASTQLYRSFKIGQTAQISTGAVQGGVDIGTGTANTWYAIYAVKVTSAPIAGNFVIVGSTQIPVPANFTTINTEFGTNRWSYLGLVRVGDQNASPAVIVRFYQAGHMTLFRNQNSSQGNTLNGFLLATASATTKIYTYSAGVSSVSIPSNIDIGLVYGASNGFGGAASTFDMQSPVSPFAIYAEMGGATICTASLWLPVLTGVQIDSTGSTGLTITLAGFIDRVLGIGANPSY